MQGDDDVGTVPLSAMDFGHDLRGDLRGNNVVAAALAVALPHEARAHEVLILDVYEAPGAPDVVHVSACILPRQNQSPCISGPRVHM